ncbi:hypothetical protein [Acinetobacter gyllenbergii]|uniref:hypothetical protein n=1 Tax=Acinetobacter gyllenbergii TaxID=134534 RepID=UPI000806B0B2|nr:hypothetical protein [Acinetobacter gyllenbergii]OBY75641.1 hypothetical protein NG55_02920 [Acinetobacter gyllenbergii]
MMSVFIANFKASEHPIINVVARGFVIMIAGFFIALFSSIINDWKFFIFFTLLVGFIGGGVGTILIFLIEVSCDCIWRKEK